MRKFTDEHRLKLSLARRGKKRTPHTAETKLKMSLASKGRKKSEAHKKALSIARTGLPHVLTEKGKESFRQKMSGANNWKWIEDRSKIVGRHNRNFHDGEYKQWVLSVRNRDGWKCRISNGDCSGRLETHHILGWKSHPDLRYQVNNGITLCHFHHPRKRVDEIKLSPYFQSMVASVD